MTSHHTCVKYVSNLCSLTTIVDTCDSFDDIFTIKVLETKLSKRLFLITLIKEVKSLFSLCTFSGYHVTDLGPLKPQEH